MVVVKPSLTRVPVRLLPVPVQYVANAPISHSLGLKYSGGGGAGVITCFASGSPAKATTACDARVTTAKAANFFIEGLPYRWFSDVYLGHAMVTITSRLDNCSDRLKI